MNHVTEVQTTRREDTQLLVDIHVHRTVLQTTTINDAMTKRVS